MSTEIYYFALDVIYTAEYIKEDDKPRDVNTNYPSGYIVPFHFKHPVTGRKSGEAKRNASFKRQEKPNP